MTCEDINLCPKNALCVTRFSLRVPATVSCVIKVFMFGLTKVEKSGYSFKHARERTLSEAILCVFTM